MEERKLISTTVVAVYTKGNAISRYIFSLAVCLLYCFTYRDISVVRIKGVSFQSICGAASVRELNTKMWFVNVGVKGVALKNEFLPRFLRLSVVP